MLFKEGATLYATEVERRNGEDVLHVNYIGAPFVPSLAENPEVMRRTVEVLAENPTIARIIFVQQRNYHYNFEQTKMLAEVANFHNFLVKQEAILSMEKLSIFGDPQRLYAELAYYADLLKQDPIKCYLELKRFVRALREESEKTGSLSYVRFLERIIGFFEGLQIIQKTIGKMGETIGRDVYYDLFRADILPNFTFTRLIAQLPTNAELIDQYEVGGEYEKVIVTVLKKEHDAKYFYHIMPPEYTLSDEQHMLVNLARNVLTEHRPKAEEFTDPERTRQVFFNVAKDLLTELSKSKNISLTYRELQKLAKILVRHTIGFGLIEILLLDNKLQDIVLNAPIAQNPIFIRHEKYDECVTNVIPSFEDAESWAAKLRLQSGRALDEANPVLDTDLVFGEIRARIAAIKEPLSPNGLAYALRRHRDKPWTLPLFVKNKMLNSFAAGLLSFMIDGNRTLLVAGTRSSGKTSLLGSLMLEILSKYRVIVVEDTLELPIDAMKKLNYDILRMKVRSALVEGATELAAAEGIRTSLRLGDSALIVGEVRSSEAKALYEAMRVGALANVVAGTIHGDSPYGVFDRVVNDLGVEATSFKATDLIIISNPVKTPDGMHSNRRIISICEVRKHWTKDPLAERGFVELMRYNVEKDELEPTEELINGDSEIIKSIASSVKGWAGNWEAVYDNIILRGKIKQEIVNAAEKLKIPEILEAEFNVFCNIAFHELSEKDRQDNGSISGERVFSAFKKWLYDKAILEL